MSALLDLAARCEAASETEQQKLIAEAVFAVFPQASQARIHAIRLLDAHAFLDVAMTLVPEGRGWLAGFPPSPADANEYIAEAEAATPALALCAAALRARAALPQKDRDDG